MQITSGLLNDFVTLSAYGEYSEEKAIQAVKKSFVPINHLGSEQSPYLLRLANSPVGWYAWGAEAFDTARREDKPIFLSIGYYSEHWCAVMDRDCFYDVEVAGFLNDACIPVKVDREERPDLDNLFMEVCRIQNGSAGWPLNIFLTPEGRPFFCTTWLPKRTTGQMPGLTDLLPRIKWLWHVQREDVERSARELGELISERFAIISGEKFKGRHVKKFTAFEALNDMRKIFDVRWGGFGNAPKFPEPDKLLFLLEQAHEKSGASKRDKADAMTMVDITLRRMWRGGIHDHLGGGFSRYAVDERWLVPHFEKLLCYQAMLLLIASKAQELQQNSFHRLFAEDIIFCVTKYFCDDNSYSQGFRSSIDGDTPEGEGRYYLWTEDEIKNILKDDAGLFCAAYAVLPSGNFGSELAGSQMGLNILYEASTVTELAKRYGLKGAEVGLRLENGRKLLLDYRDKRFPLQSDNKILMSWNGLMIGALSHASVSFNQSEWRDIAERGALFIQKNFPDKNKNSWHRCWINGQAYIDALAEDYSYFLWGIMELYKAAKFFNAGEKQLNDWLKCAQEIADILMEKFIDEKNGGLFQNAGGDANIFVRFKNGYDDNSLPSYNAFAAVALNELAQILEEKKYSDCARKIIDCFSHDANENPLSYLSLIEANSQWKPVRKKPAPPPPPVPTDEELNREEEPEQIQEPPPEQRRAARTARRAAATRTTTPEPAKRTERASRRSARTHRR